MLLLVICIVYMFLLAANKQVVDTQESLEILQEKASPLTCQLNKRQTKITQLIESRKGMVNFNDKK